MDTLTGRTLITGATAFIGCRLAEVGVARGETVTTFVHSWHRAARLARLPLRLLHGDFLDPAALREAVKGCDVVYHCAFDSRVPQRDQRRANVQGTVNLMQAALEAGVKRVVVVSTIGVHGFWPADPLVTEDMQPRLRGDPYIDAKIDSEAVAFDYHRRHGLPVTVIRPALVYGPFETRWAERMITSIKAGRMVLVNGGTGICNCVYVDNLVDAMRTAAREDGAIGESFIISDETPVTWSRMIGAHAEALGRTSPSLPVMTLEEIRERWLASIRDQQSSSVRAAIRLLRQPRTREALRTIPAFRRAHDVMRTLRGFWRVDGDGLGKEMRMGRPRSGDGERSGNGSYGRDLLLNPKEATFYSCQATFSIEKARRVLGYQPKVRFEEGMERTARWIRWMKL